LGTDKKSQKKIDVRRKCTPTPELIPTHLDRSPENKPWALKRIRRRKTKLDKEAEAQEAPLRRIGNPTSVNIFVKAIIHPTLLLTLAQFSAGYVAEVPRACGCKPAMHHNCLPFTFYIIRLFALSITHKCRNMTELKDEPVTCSTVSRPCSSVGMRQNRRRTGLQA